MMVAKRKIQVVESLDPIQSKPQTNALKIRIDDLKTFQTIAKTIDADRYFTIYGCQSCVRELVKFVYDNQNNNAKA